MFPQETTTSAALHLSVAEKGISVQRRLSSSLQAQTSQALSERIAVSGLLKRSPSLPDWNSLSGCLRKCCRSSKGFISIFSLSRCKDPAKGGDSRALSSVFLLM